jgi:uncharacterized cupin superfamily protein
MKILVERNPSEQVLDDMGVRDWPIWTKEISEFPWSYDASETCYVLEGHVVVTPKDGEPVEIQAGDLVTFPRGMACSWKITQPIKKHYRFG